MKKIIILSIVLIFICTCFAGCESEPCEPIISEYEVISVQTYMKISTGTFGDIIDQELRYNFIYIDSEGELHQFTDFYHKESGLSRRMKLRVGIENKYVIERCGDSTNHYLYLTEEMFDRLSQHVN